MTFPATFPLSSLDGSNGFRLDGVASNDYSGGSVSGGDVNGDGFADLIVGASGAGAGATYVVFGKTLGFGSSLALSSLDGTNGFRLDGVGEAGFSVSAAGDVNGDHIPDLIIGAPHASDAGFYSGTSYVV